MLDVEMTDRLEWIKRKRGAISEIWSVFISKEESLMVLDRGIEDEIVTDDLETEVANAQEYQDLTLIWKARTTRFIQKAHDSERVRVSYAKFNFIQVIEYQDC